jgi:hypothetical protein
MEKEPTGAVEMDSERQLIRDHKTIQTYPTGGTRLVQDTTSDGGELSDSVGAMDTNVSDGADLESSSSLGGGGVQRAHQMNQRQTGLNPCQTQIIGAPNRNATALR